MKLYERDYLRVPMESEIKEYELILEEEKKNRDIGRINLYSRYPEAIRHHYSLFPNNHIDLLDWKKSGKMGELTDEFSKIVHNIESKEMDILKFINHKPAQYIIGSLLSYKDFGHHETYIFRSFLLAMELIMQII